MSVQKAISGNNVKNNGSSLLHAGNVTRNEIGSLDFGDANMNYMRQGLVSGLTIKAISGGDFNVENRLVAMALTTSIAGSSLTALVGGAGMEQTKGINGWGGYNRRDITSIDMLTGDVVYGAANGDYVLASGLDNTTGANSDINASPDVYNVPHTLTYRLDEGAINDNYSPRTL